MKLISTYPFVLFIFLFASIAYSQQSINGIVFDENNEPLAGASVVLSGTTQGTQTNRDGRFSLTFNEPFPATIQVSYVGFSTETVYVQSSATVQVFLATNRFDKVVVSASRRAEKLQEAPAAVSVVTADQVSLSGGSLSPLRALTNTPGVELQQQTGQRINIALRGASGIFSTNVFPMLDYRSLITPGLEYFDSQNSPLSTIDLDRVEVVLGPGSALYGPDVTSGVVHFISKTLLNIQVQLSSSLMANAILLRSGCAKRVTMKKKPLAIKSILNTIAVKILPLILTTQTIKKFSVILKPISAKQLLTLREISTQAPRVKSYSKPRKRRIPSSGLGF